MPNIPRRDFLRAGLVGGGAWLGGMRLDNLLAAVPTSAAASTTPLPLAARPSTADDLAYLTIWHASELIRRREISPTDLVQACLKRIERFDPGIKAWLAVYAQDALAAARTATEEIARNGPRSPLHGIPIGHKDLYDIAGKITTAGSKVRADARPATRNATVVALLQDAGAITLGKLNTHEFAYGVWTPPTSNPWDTTRIPGGSSGGSAAALAAGMCLGATGSDTGGSIRIPASLCNTVGIKPTFGRVGKGGLIPLAWSLDHAGPLTRSVEDCALMLNEIAGPDPRDPTTAPVRPPDFTQGLGKSVRGFVVGVPTSVFFDGADPETEALVRAAIPALESLGVTVREVDVPSTQYIASSAYLVVQLAEPLSAHEHYLRQRPHDYQSQTHALFALGAGLPAQHYLRAQRLRTINIREWAELFGEVDAVLTPTTPRPAPAKEEASATGVVDLVNYTSLFDFNGCPSISVPAGLTAAGLPVGLMLSARPFDEVRLLQLAHAYQSATGFNGARPSLA